MAIGQINFTVGALDENVRRMGGFIAQARRAGAEILAFPELSVTGYPPEDLLFKPVFIEDNLTAARKLASLTRGLTVVAGFVDRNAKGELFNAAAVYHDGRWIARYRKMHLPNYGVFDEKRYFTSGSRPFLLEFGNRHRFHMGLSICEDIWVEDTPCRQEAEAGAGLLLNISASPYHAGKLRERERVLIRRAKAYGVWVAYINLVGGQDELVFDGASLLVNPQGRVVFQAPQFKEGLFFVEIPEKSIRRRGDAARWDSEIEVATIPPGIAKVSSGRWKTSPSRRSLSLNEEIFHALVLGLRDYVRKNGFSRVVLGLSGGIDSALTASLAVAALGQRAVTGASLSSRYSSEGTRRDAWRTAEALGIRFLEIPIERMFQAALDSLEEAIGKTKPDITEENLQARIRGLFLMALSNKFGWLVLATGNKSEISTGYCTLYGDMIGGFAVIKDVPKTRVYALSRTANRFFRKNVIPESVFRRPPAAELKYNQTDRDTLPPYDLLDAVIRAYVEERHPSPEIQRRLKLPRSLVTRVIRMVDRNEYKRRQAPIGIKITPLAFGKDRRIPVTNRYQE